MQDTRSRVWMGMMVRRTLKDSVQIDVPKKAIRVCPGKRLISKVSGSNHASDGSVAA